MVYSKMSAAYEGLSQREKVLISGSSFAVLMGLVFLLLIEPQYVSLQEQSVKHQRSAIALEQDELSIQQLQQLLAEDPILSAQQEIDALALEQKVISDELLQADLSVLSARGLTDFLADVLAQSKGLQVESFEVASQAFSAADEILDVDDVFVLKQQINIKLQGSQSQLLNFLTNLEGGTVKMVWDSINVQSLDDSQRSIDIAFHVFSAIE